MHETVKNKHRKITPMRAFKVGFRVESISPMHARNEDPTCQSALWIAYSRNAIAFTPKKIGLGGSFCDERTNASGPQANSPADPKLHDDSLEALRWWRSCSRSSREWVGISVRRVPHGPTISCGTLVQRALRTLIGREITDATTTFV